MEGKMKRKLSLAFIVIAMCSLPNIAEAQGQSTDIPKFEVGADFTTITFGAGQSELGLGGRLTYNLNKHVALEGTGFFFPRECHFCARGNDGRITEGLFGVKVGKRFEKWGIFGKARPGVISFSQGKFDLVPTTGIPATGVGAFPFDFQFERLTTLAFDVGGVVEFYPSKRIVTRLDFGDTIIHYGPRTFNNPVFNSTTSTYTLAPSTVPSQTRGSFQVSVGVGWRF
jgi:hypothetical protein